MDLLVPVVRKDGREELRIRNVRTKASGIGAKI
jgi:hypothetical protein